MLLETGLKGQIISILSEEFPLQVAEIEEQLFLMHKKKFTKQAIHKALIQLKKRNIISKEEHAYQLAPRFIYSLEQYVHKLKSQYFSKSSLAFDVPARQKREFTSTSLLQHDSLWNSIISEKMIGYKKKEYAYVQQVPHAWFALSHVEAEIQVTNLINERCKGFYTLVNGGTPLDSWVGRFYQGEGSYYHTLDEKCVTAQSKQLAVIGEYILECNYPVSIAERLAWIFESAQNLSMLNLQELIALVNAPTELVITLHRDKARARKLTERIISFF